MRPPRGMMNGEGFPMMMHGPRPMRPPMMHPMMGGPMMMHPMHMQHDRFHPGDFAGPMGMRGGPMMYMDGGGMGGFGMPGFGGRHPPPPSPPRSSLLEAEPAFPRQVLAGSRGSEAALGRGRRAADADDGLDDEAVYMKAMMGDFGAMQRYMQQSKRQGSSARRRSASSRHRR